MRQLFFATEITALDLNLLKKKRAHLQLIAMAFETHTDRGTAVQAIAQIRITPQSYRLNRLADSPWQVRKGR